MLQMGSGSAAPKGHRHSVSIDSDPSGLAVLTMSLIASMMLMVVARMMVMMTTETVMMRIMVAILVAVVVARLMTNVTIMVAVEEWRDDQEESVLRTRRQLTNTTTKTRMGCQC